MWAESNKLLIDEVNAIAQKISEKAQKSYWGWVLIKVQVLFALRISDREDIQQALADGLAKKS